MSALGKDAPGSAAATRGWAAYERGDVATAATELKDASAAPGARPWVFYVLGMSQFAQQQYKDAAAAWETVRRAAPEFEPVYMQLADAYSLLHEEGTGIAVLRDAQQRWPQDAEIPNAIGVVQVRRGALDAAIQSFEHAAAVAPNDSLAYFNLGRAHQLRFMKAQRYVREMQKWVGGEADHKKAIEYYEKYVQMGGPFVQQAKEALAALAWK